MPDSLRPMKPIKRTPFVEEVLPVHGTQEANRVPHDPVRPCAGYGLDNPANARQYIQGFKKLQRDWPHLTPGQRKMRLQDLSHQQLKKSGVPGIPIVPLPLQGAAYAQTNFAQWQINMPEHVLDAPHLPDADAKQFASALYHENRHAEQAYLVMRRQAGIVSAQSHGKLTPQQQVQQMEQQLRRGGENFAPPDVMREAQKQPLHKGDAQEPCAQMMSDTFVGKNANHASKAEDLDGPQHRADLARNRYAQVSQEEKAAVKKRDQADAALNKADALQGQWQVDQIKGLPSVLSASERQSRINQILQAGGPANLQAGEQQAQSADDQAVQEANNAADKLDRANNYWYNENKLLEKSDTIYHNLPSEADAWDCQNTVTALWDQH